MNEWRMNEEKQRRTIGEIDGKNNYLVLGRNAGSLFDEKNLLNFNHLNPLLDGVEI